MDDFEVLTMDDKRHAAYGLCVLGFMAAGATFGSFAGGQTILGAAGATVVGLFACKGVEEPLRKKLFDSASAMSEAEFIKLVQQTKRAYPGMSKPDVLDLIGTSKSAAIRNPQSFAVRS